MSDEPADPDWWQASDGRWYPPEQHPGNLPPPPSGRKRGEPEFLPKGCNTGIEVGCGIVLVLIVVLLLLVLLLA